MVELKTEDAFQSYAILSHRWIEGQEVSYKELRDNQAIAKAKSGYWKIQRACFIALCHNVNYLWVDTCCINQEDPSDVAQNINSMYEYYRNSRVCLTYLFDVRDTQKSIAYSEWFKRGWTLQELVAPRKVFFFDQNWFFRGDRTSFKSEIWWVTGIDQEVLQGLVRDLEEINVRDRIAWARGRKTTKIQDMAYCLLGVLGVELEVYEQEPVEDTFKRLEEAFLRAYPEVGRPPDGIFMFLTGVSKDLPSSS